jgi:hypothetical protein
MWVGSETLTWDVVTALYGVACYLLGRWVGRTKC